MKYVIRNVGGLAAYVLGILFLSSPVVADFELQIDGSTLREVTFGSYEIDAFLNVTPTPATPSTIQSILLNLKIAPANGYSLSQITGVQFDGVRNPDSNTVFPNPNVSVQPFGPLSMVASLVNSSPVGSPSSSRLAFTVMFSTNNGTASDVEIQFASAGNLYEIDRLNEGNVYPFATLVSSPPITVVRVPEPASCLLASLGLGGVWLTRRWQRRK